MNNDRYDFNFSHVEHDTGMLDWMIFGEARHAVYTQESGYATNARGRAGVSKQICDVKVGKVEDTNECVCLRNSFCDRFDQWHEK
jgi:hypothetical protein